jgi:hypothetical protein
MPSRQDLLNLQQRVKAAIATLAEMKRTPQPMAGDSWVYYRRMIAPAWDLELHGITSSSFVKVYKVTYGVARPYTGFALPFVEVDWDTPAQDMSYAWSPVRDDPYSWWLRVNHVTYNSTSAGIMIRFNIFAPQTGIITVTEIP